MSRAVIISTTWVCAVWFTVVGVGYAIAGDWALVAPYLCAATGWVSAAVAKTRLEQVRRLHTADEFGLREHLRAIGGAALTSQRRAAYLSNARTITADTVSPRFAARSCAAFHTSSGTRTERSLVSATAAQLAVTCAICGKRGEVCDGEQRPLVGVGDVGGRGRMGLDACGQPVSGVFLANDCAVEVHPEVADLRSSSHVYTVSQFGPFVYTGAP